MGDDDAQDEGDVRQEVWRVASWAPTRLPDASISN